MKQVDLIKYLRKYGCVFMREGNLHTVWLNPINSRTSTIPRHTEINTFTGRKICKDLGIPIIKIR